MTATTQFSIQLCNFCYNKNSVQLIGNPTHQQGNILHIILTNSPDRLVNIMVDLMFCSAYSDHFLITLDILTSHTYSHSHPVISSPFYHLSRADMGELACYLLEYSFLSHSTDPLDIHFVWSDIKQGILTACELFVPRVHMTSKCSPPWFNSTIRHLQKKIRTLRKVTKRTIFHITKKNYLQWNPH